MLDGSSEVGVEPGEVAYASGTSYERFLVSEVLGVVESDNGVANAVLEDFADGLRRYFDSEPAIFLVGEEDPEVTL